MAEIFPTIVVSVVRRIEVSSPPYADAVIPTASSTGLNLRTAVNVIIAENRYSGTASTPSAPAITLSGISASIGSARIIGPK
jgi:hypothetical protein